MHLAIVQNNPIFGEVRCNIEKALALMEQKDANLYVLPELFATGYNFIDENEVKALAETITSKTYQRIADFAYDRNCYVIYGFPEKDVKVYNSAAFVGPSGLVGVYRKIHLFNKEKLFFARGNLGFQVFSTELGRIGIMICFDWIFPESARTLALKGAQLIAHPANLVLPYGPNAMVTRCIENRVFNATANRIGTESRGNLELSFIGKSEIVAPDGTVLTRLSSDVEEIDVADVDLTSADNKALNAQNHLFGDRAPEYYQLS